MQIEREFTSDFGKEIFELAKSKISKHTVQIFTLDEIDGHIPLGSSFSYKPIGSGVLISFNDDYYVFSATHVFLDGLKPRLLYIGANGDIFIPIQGFASLITQNEIDLAAVKLEPYEIFEIKEFFEFLTVKNINVNHTIENKGISEYLITGFPIKSTKFKNYRFISGCYSMVTKLAKDDHYVYYGYHKDKHFLLDYYSTSREIPSLKKSKGKKDSDLKGLSGSGLWHYEVISSRNYGKESFSINYKLIGILIENQDSKFKVLAATRIKFLMDFLTF